MPTPAAKPGSVKKFGDRVLEREWQKSGENFSEAARRLLDADASGKQIKALAKEVSRAVERMKEGTSVEQG
jgi:hypothetical protein